MWPRIVEILIAAWLLVAHFVLHYDGWADFFAAGMIVLLASLSLWERLSKIHLLEIVPISLLLYVSYTYPNYQLPFSLQNFIVTVLTLLFFFIIPSDATQPPKAWRVFLKKFDSKEE